MLDDHDTRIINETRSGTFTYRGSVTGRPGLPDNQADVGGWEDYPTIHRPAGFDSDRDGMPNSWETDNDLNPNDPDDRNGIGEGGYTNLEIYLNSMAGITTNIESTNETVPNGFALAQNYPNPFNSSTTILFAIPYQTKFRIDVYDITGRKVTELFNEGRPAGQYEVDFVAEDLSSGVYFYRLSYAGRTFTRKMLLIK